MDEKNSFRPLHALVDHQWNPTNVKMFFWAVLAALDSWFGWGATVWTNDYNPHTGQGGNYFLGAIIGIVFVSLAFVALSVHLLWEYEERHPTTTKKELEQRIAELESEVLIHD